MRDYKYEAALKFVNGVRDELDLFPLTELQPGRCGDPYSCPITTSIGRKRGSFGALASARGEYTLRGDEDGRERKLWLATPDATNFAAAFDGGEYPELEL